MGSVMPQLASKDKFKVKTLELSKPFTELPVDLLE